MKLYSNALVTMELREVLKTRDENGNPFDLWDFDYPAYYTGDDKKAFEQKVIDHYFFRQIGAETIARFKHNFKTRVREIMPRYIELYKTVEIMANIDDPFGNVDVTETFEETRTGSETGGGSATVTGRTTDTKTVGTSTERRESDTPQGAVSNLDDYLSRAAIESANGDEDATTDTESTSTTGSTTESEGTVKHTLTRKGNQGVNTYAHDMIEFRQSIIDVDRQIIDDLNDLFLMVY